MRALRRKIMVVVAVSTVAVAVLVLARSLPFASGSTSPAATGHSGVRNVGAGTAMGALNRLPVKGKAPMTGYARARFGRAWTDDADQGLTSPWGHNGCDTRNDALARDLDQAHTRPGSRCVIVSGKLHDPYTGATLTWRRGRHTSTTVQIRSRRSSRERMDYRRAKTLTAATHRPGQRPVELAGCRRTR